jgi:hypothetical protein
MESGNPINYLPYRDAGFYQPLYDLIVNQTGCHNQTDTFGLPPFSPVREAQRSVQPNRVSTEAI